jgi:hypothetical protein
LIMAKPGYTETNILTEVLKADPDHYKPEDVYEFSNGRTFKSTDNTDSGIYED